LGRAAIDSAQVYPVLFIPESRIDVNENNAYCPPTKQLDLQTKSSPCLVDRSPKYSARRQRTLATKTRGRLGSCHVVHQVHSRAHEWILSRWPNSIAPRQRQRERLRRISKRGMTVCRDRRRGSSVFGDAVSILYESTSKVSSPHYISYTLAVYESR
jgi:hypothetical protein